MDREGDEGKERKGRLRKLTPLWNPKFATVFILPPPQLKNRIVSDKREWSCNRFSQFPSQMSTIFWSCDFAVSASAPIVLQHGADWYHISPSGSWCYARFCEWAKFAKTDMPTECPLPNHDRIHSPHYIAITSAFLYMLTMCLIRYHFQRSKTPKPLREFTRVTRMNVGWR